MKKQDLAIIIVVVAVAGIFSTVMSKIFITAKNTGLTAEVVEKIDSDFPQKDTETYVQIYAPIFNSQAINPTKPSQVSTTSPSQGTN